MSSLRPATIVATLFHLIGGSLAEEAEPDAAPPARASAAKKPGGETNRTTHLAPGSRRVRPDPGGPGLTAHRRVQAGFTPAVPRPLDAEASRGEH